jgi:hypothetical protein
MQKISVLSFLLFGVLCNAQADDIEITGPKISNINCGAAPINAIFKVTNTINNTGIILYPATIEVNDDFPQDLTMVETGGLTTCPLDNKTKLPALASCNINVIITPEDCSSGTILGDISRTLVVGVSTRQIEAESSFAFSYTQLGAADDFAILSDELHNMGSVSSVVGSVGHTGTTPISGQFNVTNGQLYTSPTDPNVTNANNAFLTTYQMFIANKANCRVISDISFPAELQSSYYCLTSNQGLDEVTVDGLIILSGTGDFVFFVDDGENNCFSITPSGPCNLHLKSATSFAYKDGASEDKIYWITGNDGSVILESGVELDGTVLSGVDISTSSAGPSPASIDGHLWALGTITLYGDSVAIPD